MRHGCTGVCGVRGHWARRPVSVRAKRLKEMRARDKRDERWWRRTLAGRVVHVLRTAHPPAEDAARMYTQPPRSSQPTRSRDTNGLSTQKGKEKKRQNRDIHPSAVFPSTARLKESGDASNVINPRHVPIWLRRADYVGTPHLLRIYIRSSLFSLSLSHSLLLLRPSGSQFMCSVTVPTLRPSTQQFWNCHLGLSLSNLL